ncbi:MAG: ABC transporter permease subunit [Aliidongia sp.]
MFQFLTRRLLAAAATLLALVVIAFAVLKLAPGGPFDLKPSASPASLAQVQRSFHHDQPLYAQFGHYLGGVVHLDFGPSFGFRDHDVADLLFRGASITIEIVCWALAIAVAAGIPLGALTARIRGSLLDQALLVLGVIGLAVPIFVLTPVLQLVFAIGLNWLPVAGWDGGWVHKILPVATLVVPLTAVVARLVRGSIRDAAPVGAGNGRERLKAGLAAILARMGFLASGALILSVPLERAFALPGTGRYLDQAGAHHDYPVLAGALIFYGGLVILAGLLGSLLVQLLGRDPAFPIGTEDDGRPVVSGIDTLPHIWRSLHGDRIALSAACAVLAAVALVLVVPALLSFSPDKADYGAISVAPSWSAGHLLGTDDLGRDLLAEALVGGRVSILLTVAAASIAALLLFVWRAAAARGRPFRALGGLIDALPFLVLAIAFRAMAATVVEIASLAWLILWLSHGDKRGIVLAISSAVPAAFTGEAYLSYFDIGAREPTLSLGGVLANGLGDIDLAPWEVFGPVAVLLFIVVSLTLFVQRVRDAAVPGGYHGMVRSGAD